MNSPAKRYASVARSWCDWVAAPVLAAAVSLFIVAVDNDSFWKSAWRATANDEHRFAILLSLFAIVFLTLTITLCLALGRGLLKALAVSLLVLAAAFDYFMTQYGVIIDQAMVRNTVETTVLEATPFLSTTLFWHVAMFGLLPALVVLMVPLPSLRWYTEGLSRTVAVAASALVLVATLYLNYAAVSFFGHENHRLRVLINPGYPIVSAIKFAVFTEDVPTTRKQLPMQLTASDPLRKPALMIFVMGETARADRFSLNGYERDTNRYTEPLEVVTFPTVYSCGTSTAESVPCLFSAFGRAGFTHDAAARQESLVSALQRIGVATYWRDNSTGCKDVCDVEHFEQRATWTDEDLCDDTGCFDELLIRDLDQLLTDHSKDHFIVLHQRGSHGPAYHTNVPDWAKQFFPECALASLRNCDRTSVNNAYDNTILYTDYFLSRVIAELKLRSTEFDTAMLYVSDHGESLGENGFYLHGLPHNMAPEEQVRVPMLLWASQDFYAHRAGIDRECLRATARTPTSHDAIFHTLLPLFHVESPLYDISQDLFAYCRSAADR